MALKDICKYANPAFYVITLRSNFSVFRKFYTVKCYQPNMKVAYFQADESDSKCHIVVSLQQHSLNLKKVLEFERTMDETIGVFLSRLNLKVRNIIEKKKKVDVDSLPENDCHLLLDNEQLIADTRLGECFNNPEKKLTLRIFGSDYDVVLNGPTVVQLMLPSEINVGLPVSPKNFIARCTDVSKCLFKWFSSCTKKPDDWTECGEGYFFIPTEKQLGHYISLICTPRNDHSEGPDFKVVSTKQVQEFKFLSAIENRHKYTVQETGRHEIRVVSYNILADAYTQTKEAKKHIFPYCDPKVLDIEYRLPLLIRELQGYNADLYCLQEVDKNVFKKLLNQIIKSKDLWGVFYAKEKSGEGCAVFYDQNKFRVLSSAQHIYYEEINSNPAFEDLKMNIEKEEDVWDKLSQLQTQIQILVLEWKTLYNEIIVVGNTHLYFHPDADHIRLLHGIMGFRLLLETVNNFKKKCPEKNVSIIFCGDFNSSPDCGIYKLVTQGAIESNYQDWMGDKGPKIKDVSFCHNVKMKSAYETSLYTNYTSLFKECIDYIFYQTDHLELSQVVPMPTEDELSEEVALPSHSFPSDHLALVADFKYKSNQAGNTKL